MKELGQLIKQKREQKGITYYRIFKDLGLTQQQVESIENCSKFYVFASLVKLCRYLDIKIKFDSIEIK